MVEKTSSPLLTSFVFLIAVSIVVLSLVSIIFPSLIVSIASPYENNFDSFEIGALAVPMLVSNFVLFGIGLTYYKKKLPDSLSKPIKYFLNFELSPKMTLIVAAVLLSIYIGYTIGELNINEEDQWPDYKILNEALKIWPFEKSEDPYIQEQNERHVRMFLLLVSQNIFQNIKVLPFVASILLVVLTYFITYQISGKRFAGIISMVVLLQSYTFLTYDSLAIYENFWALFYILSFYGIYKKWYISSLSYLLSIFTKAFAILYFPMNLFFIYRSRMTRKQKIIAAISYLVVVTFALSVIFVGQSTYGSLISVDLSQFWIGFTVWSYQMRFDYLMILTILPLTAGLFLTSRRGIKEADSILVLILGALLAGSVLASITEFYFILPYRFVPLVVFFSIGVGILLSKKKSS